MKFIKTTGLTLFFFIGILVPSCDWVAGDDDCNCSGSRYFDIEGLGLSAFVDEGQEIQVVENDVLRLEQFEGFYLDYLVDYHAMAAPKTDWSFNWMSTAMACSCIVGYDGSKNEALEAFTITTLNDFDDDHLAGSSLNDLFTYGGSFFMDDNRSLEDFLTEEKQSTMMFEDMRLNIGQAPMLDSVFQVRMSMELSTGETYEVESVPFVLLPN